MHGGHLAGHRGGDVVRVVRIGALALLALDPGRLVLHDHVAAAAVEFEEHLARAVRFELADRQLARMPEAEQEKRDWLRPPGDPSLDGVPAEATRGPAASYSAPFVQRDFSLPQVEPTHARPGVDAPLVGVLCTPLDAPVNWLQGGRALMDVLVETAVVGGSASYLNQPLELAGTRDVLTNDLDLPGHPQVVLRIGRGASVAAPPRRAVMDVVNRVP